MRLAKTRSAALPLAALALMAAPAWGQANPRTGATCYLDDATPLMCQILVVGNLPTSLGEETEAIVEIETAPGERIENSLRDVAGLQQFRRSDASSANPTSQGVTLRGLGGNASSRALLFVDGVPQADPFGGWVSWPQYDALNLASARIRRGGGQVAAGPGAIAGVIELDSRQRRHISRINARYGSRNSVDARAAGMFALGKGELSVSGSYARGDGFTPVVKRQRGTVDRQAPYEQAAINLRAVAPISDDTELQANLRGFTDDRDRGFDFSDSENSGVDASLRLVGEGDLQWSALGYVQLREFATRFGSVAADRNSVRLVLDQFSVPSTGLGARFELRPPIGDEAELRLGVDWRRNIGETNERFFFIGDTPQRSRNAGGRTDTLGAFLQGSWKPADELTLTAGGRIDRWYIANGFRRQVNLTNGDVQSDENFADRSGWEGSGRIGAAWRPGGSDYVTIRAGGNLGWRLPMLNELYRPFRVGAVTTMANEMLSPERLRGAEIGVRYDDGDELDLSLTAFWNRLENAIANVTLDDGTGSNRQRRNLDAVDSKGIELDASYDLAYRVGLNDGYESLILRASYAYTDAEVRGEGDALLLDGLRPAQVPEHSAAVSLDYDDRPGLKLGATLRYFGSQFEDDGNTRRLDDAFTVDARLGYDLTGLEKWILEARAENIFDAEVQAGFSGSGVIERTRPQTFSLGLRVKL